KRDLQIEVVRYAAEVFTGKVWRPNAELAPGRDRLLGCLDTWYAYSASGPFRGGCLLTAASVEFDGRPGPVRDAVADANRSWSSVLRGDLDRAVDAGELDPPLDSRSTVLAVESLAAG